MEFEIRAARDGDAGKLCPLILRTRRETNGKDYPFDAIERVD